MGNFAFGQLWQGDYSKNWYDYQNWDNNIVPDLNDDVTIDDPILYDIEINGTEECKSITFYNNGKIFFATGGTYASHELKVYGDFINYSNNANIIGNNNGHITMAGSSNTVIDGWQDIELYHLWMDKDNFYNTVNIVNNLSIWLSIKLIIGELVSDGTLFYRVDPSNGTTASSTPFNDDTRITGRVTIEQRVPYSGLYYHYLSSPVGDGIQNGYYTIFKQMSDNTSSANVFNWTNNYINSSFPDWFVYDETQCAGETPAEVITFYQGALSVTLTTAEAEWLLTSFGWTCNEDILTQELPAGTGVLSRVEFDTPGDIVDWRGYLNDSHIDVELSNTTCDFGDGLNFLGNPYPSPIDWDLLYDWNDAEVEPFAYVWTPDAGATGAFGAGPGDGYFTIMDASNSTAIISSPAWSEESGAIKDSIAIGQGFFVRALDDNSSFQFWNGCRNLYNPTPAIMRESKPKETLQLLLQSTSGKDYTNIYLNNSSSDAFDNREDALKMPNPHLNLATLNDGKKLMINRLSKQQDEIIVPLHISQKSGETTILSIGQTPFESNEYIALFIDKKLNNQQIITKDFKFTYTNQSGEANDRFAIKFVRGNGLVNNGSISSGNMYMANAQLHIFAENFDKATVSITDASGRMMQQENVLFSGSKGLVNLNELSAGIYMVNVQSTKGSINQKVCINK